MSLYRYTKALLRKTGCHPRKYLGQNFLVDATVLETIVQAAELSPDDVVLEIGAGTGILTQRLALSSSKLIAVELDEGLFCILRSEFEGKPNVTLIHADVLDLDVPRLMVQDNPAGIKVIGNLPYYITTPILMKLLDASNVLPIRMILTMVQEEVGKRMVASPGSKDYGSLSIAIAYRSDVEILSRVSARSFYPIPKVDSVLIRLNIRQNPVVKVSDETFFFQLIRSAFQYRRKTLRNALLLASRSGGVQLSADILDAALADVGIDPKRRGETLDILEFADLANAGLSQKTRSKAE